MVEAEYVICNLRGQTRNLQAMLNYLESQKTLGHEEHAYIQEQLREIIQRLKETQRFSDRRSRQHLLRAQWLN